MSAYPVTCIRQPWASLVAMGVMDVLNRFWTYRRKGTLLIAASRVLLADEMRAAIDCIQSIGSAALLDWAHRAAMDGLPKGCLMARVKVHGSRIFYDSPWADHGQIQWLVSDARPVEQIPVIGRTGVWQWRGSLKFLPRSEFACV